MTIFVMMSYASITCSNDAVGKSTTVDVKLQTHMAAQDESVKNITDMLKDIKEELKALRTQHK